MGDRRFVVPYRKVHRARDRASEIAGMSDDAIIAALAYTGPDRDPLVANVLATEAMNRLRRTSAVMDNATEGLVLVDTEGAVRAMNPAAETLLDCSEQEMLGRPFHATVEHSDATGASTREGDSVILRIAREGGVVRGIETTFTSLTNTPLPVEVNVGGIMREGEPDGAVVTFRDIRERLAQHERLAQVLDVLAEGVLLVGKDGRVEYANRSAQRMLRLDPDALASPIPFERGWTASDPAGNPVPPERFPAHRAAALGERTTDEELTLNLPDGTTVFVSASAVPLRAGRTVTGAALSFRDVALDRQMARERREIEDRYRSLFDQNPRAVVSIDENGNFLEVNAAAEELSGYTEDEVRGRSFAPLLVEEDVERATTRFAEVLGGARQEDDYTLVRKDRTRVPIHVVGMPIVVAGRVVGMHAIIRART